MSQLDPTTTTAGDLVQAAMRECGALGLGQQPTGIDLAEGQARLQWMLQEWERKRWLVYVLQTLSVTSTGAGSYSVGPGGAIDTGAGSVRPAKLESAFLRQLQNTQPNQIDYPLEILEAREDYNNIALKSLVSFPRYAFLQADWPLATLFTYPVAQASIYGIFITIMAQLPQSFATAATKLALPYEYYSAIMYNLALRLRSKYGIPTPPPQADGLLALAKNSTNVLRNANAQIPRLQMPIELVRNGIYNIFSDQVY